MDCVGDTIYTFDVVRSDFIHNFEISNNKCTQDTGKVQIHLAKIGMIARDKYPNKWVKLFYYTSSNRYESVTILLIMVVFEFKIQCGRSQMLLICLSKKTPIILALFYLMLFFNEW